MRARTHIIKTSLLAALGAAMTMVATPTTSQAATDSATKGRGLYAPHLDRRILPTRKVPRGGQLATWYGPGFYGNGMACGGTLTTRTFGIAHRTLPCGTLVKLRYRGRSVAVRVVDRGPYSGASIDLTGRTRDYLRFASGYVHMTVVKRYRVLPKPRPTSGIVQVS
jgi:rare lipoprotein A (peptidoglycan hydrolase)